MTMKEMAPLCRKQAGLLKEQIRDLRREKQTTKDEEVWFALETRILALYPIIREMEELAEHLEHYYDRGYCRNEKYTV